MYHINAVDTVTQWQVVGCVSKISEQFLIPVLEAMLQQFPFGILGFHSDNGSEFINRRVAELLEKLLIEFTKSRASRTQDNALVEGKNGAIVRKLIGYGHIASEHAEALQKFYTAFLNPYLNYHRPCGFATVSLDARGKRQRRYPAEDYSTPYEKLKSLPEPRAISTGNHLRADGCRCVRDERHRLRQEDEFGQSRSFKALQKRIADPTALYLKPTAKGCGNDGPMESMGNRKQVSHPSHRPLEISPTTRDFHIPTAWLRPGRESGKPKPGFPLSRAGLATIASFLISKPKTKKGSRPRRGLLLVTLQNPSISETRHRFMLIFQLENAVGDRDAADGPAL